MNHDVKRWAWLIIGLIINAFGIACITRGNLGTSQISSIPYVLYLRFPAFTYGTMVFFINMVFFLMQVLLLKREFDPVQLLQIPATFLFSRFIDVWMSVLSWLNPAHLMSQMLCVFVGCVILAFGICIEVAPDVVTVPGEGVVKVIACVSKQKFGKVKAIFDVTLIVIAVVLSLIFFHTLRGVGIGTVMSACLVGPFTSIFRKLPLMHHIQFIRAQMPQQVKNA
ncbi:MAG: YitT family protein [Pseudoramibacter sp.]